ncbi:MAG: hypothetical protein HYY93_07200 [Planctomycetes bacterium]|nr:hypothetical protein [Planctomycetota bacterium]
MSGKTIATAGALTLALVGAGAAGYCGWENHAALETLRDESSAKLGTVEARANAAETKLTEQQKELEAARKELQRLAEVDALKAELAKERSAREATEARITALAETVRSEGDRMPEVVADALAPLRSQLTRMQRDQDQMLRDQPTFNENFEELAEKFDSLCDGLYEDYANRPVDWMMVWLSTKDVPEGRTLDRVNVQITVPGKEPGAEAQTFDVVVPGSAVCEKGVQGPPFMMKLPKPFRPTDLLNMKEISFHVDGSDIWAPGSLRLTDVSGGRIFFEKEWAAGTVSWVGGKAGDAKVGAEEIATNAYVKGAKMALSKRFDKPTIKLPTHP